MIDIRRIEELFASNIFEQENAVHVLYQSAFIELMICLRDLLQKAKQEAGWIPFTDDVIENSYVKDVLDAVTAIRDACCHINSFKRVIDAHQNRGSFMVIHGKGVMASINGVDLGCEYQDEVAYFYGANRILMNRHVQRSFTEAKQVLLPVLNASGFRL